jgi:hypothetical protein
MELSRFKQQRLNIYVWNRLRGEKFSPGLGHRFGDESPCQYLVCEAQRDPVLAEKINRALAYCLKKFMVRGKDKLVGSDDEAVSNIAFAAAELHTVELAGLIWDFAKWYINDIPAGFKSLSSGQTHLIRSLFLLNPVDNPVIASELWKAWWRNGKTEVDCLVFHGWARVDPDEALSNLEELYTRAGSFGFGAQVWNMLYDENIGFDRIARVSLPGMPCCDLVRDSIKEEGVEPLMQFDAAVARVRG